MVSTTTMVVGAFAAYPKTVPSQASSPLVAQTRFFAFHSNVWVNLHHFLYITARARKGLDATRPATTAALGDTVGIGALSPSLRAAFEGAVAYYDSTVATRDILFDSSLVAVNDRLAELDTASSVRGAPRLDAGIANALERAAPAYRALWWRRHDASNRGWIDRALTQLAKGGDTAARDEARAFRHPWSSTPVRVDVTAYTNWAGAYTTEHPSHINVSSLLAADIEGAAPFETLFHEVLHTMDDSLFRVLQTSFRASGKRWPRDPTHAFIFYTAGEVTRRQFPEHVPFAEAVGMWTRNADFARMLPLLRANWQPYLDGKSTLEDAMRKIAEGW
jgi:hypothetical protein